MQLLEGVGSTSQVPLKLGLEPLTTDSQAYCLFLWQRDQPLVFGIVSRYKVASLIVQQAGDNNTNTLQQQQQGFHSREQQQQQVSLVARQHLL